MALASSGPNCDQSTVSQLTAGTVVRLAGTTVGVGGAAPLKTGGTRKNKNSNVPRASATQRAAAGAIRLGVTPSGTARGSALDGVGSRIPDLPASPGAWSGAMVSAAPCAR